MKSVYINIAKTTMLALIELDDNLLDEVGKMIMHRPTNDLIPSNY